MDDAAPLYYVGLEKEYPPMMFIAADNDMENRLEQTNLLLSTLRHFRYDESQYALSILHATHCSYVSPKDHQDPRFADLIARFVASCVFFWTDEYQSVFFEGVLTLLYNPYLTHEQ